MMLPEKMNKISIEVLKTDIDNVLRYLGRRACLQLMQEKKDDLTLSKAINPLEKDIYEARLKLESLAKVLTIKIEEEADEQLTAPDQHLSLEERVNLVLGSAAASLMAPGSGKSVAKAATDKTNDSPEPAGLPAEKYIQEEEQSEELKRRKVLGQAVELLTQAQKFLDKLLVLEQKQEKLTQTLDDLQAFSNLQVAISELDNLTFLNIRMGSIEPTHIPELTQAVEGRALLIPLEKPGYFIAVSTRKGKWAMDTELNRFNFEPLAIPPEMKGLPASIFASVSSELELNRQQLNEVAIVKENFKQENHSRIALLVLIFRQLTTIDKIKQELVATRSAYQITGWMPAKEIGGVLKELDTLTAGRIAVQTFEPKEITEVRAGKIKVPVKLKPRKFMEPFERLIFAYAAPLYGTIDPTPFVACFFVLLFAIMFGDVGQGFVGVLMGLLLKRGHYRKSLAFLNKFQKFGVVFIIVGIASMFTGFLYGSFFSNEEVFVPVTRTITSALFGQPWDRFVSLQPTHGVDKVMLFFGFTLAVGAIINSIGLVINIINKFLLGNYYDAIFNKTGICGAFFFWYVIFMVIRILTGMGAFALYDIILLSLPLLLLFFREPIYRLFAGKRPLVHGSLVGLIMEGIIELLESVSYYFSNSLSFVRVGAFALSHAVLSLIIFKLVDMLAETSAGLAGQIAILLVGNLLIIFLEGMIVAIQVVRLHYYEFFSKFFTETGEEFKPFNLV